MVLIETGPFVALFDPQDHKHRRCKEILHAIRDSLFTTLPVDPADASAIVEAKSLRTTKVFILDRLIFSKTVFAGGIEMVLSIMAYSLAASSASSLNTPSHTPRSAYRLWPRCTFFRRQSVPANRAMACLPDSDTERLLQISIGRHATRFASSRQRPSIRFHWSSLRR